MSEEQAFALLMAAYQTEVENRYVKFIADVTLVNHVRAMAKALTEDSPKFGIMLCGTCGNGKTTLLRAFQLSLNYLSRNGFLQDAGIRIVDAKDVSTIMKDPNTRQVRSAPMLAIEDMGREATEVIDYGNVTCPIIDLLEYRYAEQLFTFITTNLNTKDIREKYGDRLADRFNEMLCVITFSNPSFRGLLHNG